MTDQATKDIATFPQAMLNSALIRARQNSQAHGGEKVISLGLSHAEAARLAPETAAAPVRDWRSALELVQEASEAIRIGEERADQLEGQLAQVLAEVTEEVARLNLQIADGERKLAQMEQRAIAAETRAAEAESWLARFHDTVLSAFGSVLKSERSQTPEADEKTATALPI